MGKRSLSERKISIVPASKSVENINKNERRIKRVAAYCRVSTDSKEQKISFDILLGTRRTKFNEAVDLIQDWLEDGPCLANDIYAFAAKQGIGIRTIKKAKTQLPIATKKNGQRLGMGFKTREMREI